MSDGRDVVSVLIADDEPNAIRVVKLGLERAGFEVETAPNGEEALALLREHRFDVLVTDINMPRMTGRELCETLEKEPLDYELVVFVLTARTGLGHRQWTDDIANVEFLEKPASVRQLVARIRDRTGAAG